MERREKVDEIPPQAIRLYIKLYCEKKGDQTEKTCQEARNSWSSLSINKKKHFYKTSANRKLLMNAHGLSKIETFLKEKYPKKQSHSLNKLLCNSDHGKGLEPNAAILSSNESSKLETELITDDKNENHSNSCDISDNEQCTGQLDDQDSTSSTASAVSDNEWCIDQLDNNQEAEKESWREPTPLIDIRSNETSSNNGLEAHNNTCSNQERMEVVPLDEPTPPSIKNGRHLYEVMKQSDDKRKWHNLDRPEKIRYGLAARVLKIQYIQKYKIYLESLSQQELFDHYVKTLYH